MVRVKFVCVIYLRNPENSREFARRINYYYGFDDMGEIEKFFSQIKLKFMNCREIYNHF